MRGGDRTNRRSFSRDEIELLAKKYKEHNDKLYNPVTEKIYTSYKKWFSNITFWLCRDSCNYFFYLLENPHYSEFSGTRLTEESFSYSDTYKGFKGWKKYTPEEIRERVWKYKRCKPITDKQKQKISDTLKKYNKTPAGIKQRKEKSKRMKLFYQTAAGRAHKLSACKKGSISLRQKIASGEYMPKITNRWTGWDAKIIDETGDVRKFRSSWEACFWWCNQHCEYESIRVETPEKIFVSDFFDRDRKILYEIKPRSRYNIEIKKMSTLQKYCRDENIKFVWINEHNINQYIDESLFTGENLKQLQQLKKSYDKKTKD